MSKRCVASDTDLRNNHGQKKAVALANPWNKSGTLSKGSMTAQTTHIQSESYKWLVLTISTFTFTFAVAIPQMSLPVLFDEISAELGLSLVQVGWIWGAGSVLAILVGLIGGPVGDRFGPRRTLAVACLLMGIAGAA